MASVPPDAGEDRAAVRVPPGPRRARARSARLLAGLAIAVAGILIAAVIGLRPAPSPPRAVAGPPVAAVIVSVSHSGNPVVNVGYPTTLTVRALGDQAIASMELWIGARLLATASNQGGGPAQVARMVWTPAAAGPAVLIARATDARGREAQSAPLRLTVSAETPQFQPVRPVAALQGDTAASVAFRAGGEVANLAFWNEGLDPMAPLEVGTIVYVPFPAQDVPRRDIEAEIEVATSMPVLTGWPDQRRPGTVTLASWSGAGPSISMEPPAAGTGLFVPPEVTGSVEGCTIKVAVSSDAAGATGLALYGLAPDSSTFARIGTFRAGQTTDAFSTTASAGAYLFSASTYDGVLEEQGDLVELVVPEECGEPGWSGDAMLSDGRLIVSTSVDRAYLYLSQDDGPWQRIPERPDAFVDSVDGTLDFAPYLPADLASSRADIEAWGWSGAGLLPLGTGHHDPQAATASPPPAPVAGGGGADLFAGGTFTALDWIANPGTGSVGDVKVDEVLVRDGELIVWTKQGAVINPLVEDFRWQTNATGVDSVVWQVAAFPMSADLAPDHPGLLLQDVVHVDKGTQKGEFPIDLRPIFVPETLTANAGDVLNGGLVQQLALPEFQAQASAGPTALGTPQAASGGGAYSASSILEEFTPSILYIRAVPMDGGSVAGKVSNFVKLVPIEDGGFLIDTNATFPPGPVPTPAGPTGLKPYTLFLQFMPPANANPAFANCVVVTGFEAWVKPSTNPNDLQIGDFFCLFTGSSSGWSLASAFEDFVDAVASAWDAVTEAWAWMQSKLASFVATISGCKELADSDFCNGLASVAISVALTSVGIPPSLPNTKDLMNLAKGELKEVMIKAATNLIGEDPCTALALADKGLGIGTCDDIADALLDKLIAELDAMKTQEAVAITGVQVPPGANVVQHPWGTLRPPRFRLTIARNTFVPLPSDKACRMTMSMTSYVSSWTHPYYNEQTKWGTITENVAGQPFVPVTMTIPDPSKAEGAIELSPLVPKDATIYQQLLAALNTKVLINRDYYLTETSFWREPNNPTQIYLGPGKGYLSFWDQSNRAWVLLQNGAGIKATISVPPYSANCFDPVVAFSSIPPQVQGSDCTPTYGWWFETFNDPFVGTWSKKFKCAQDFKEAVGY
ncbi:MAG TPA: hypothetical protein VFM38_14210 [Candidatus Limnocylindrales bacterium]|nr:hypothetical protein [Candidatus Limnocylindrales bacterium]